MKEEMNIVVVGAGAIVASFMKKSGYNVEIVCKYEDYAAKISEQGLLISGANGIHTVKIPAVAKISQLEGKKDIVFMTVKVPDLEQATIDIKPFLKEDSVVVTLENGIVEEQMVKWVGVERTIGGVTGFGATLHEKGKAEMTSSGHFDIGTLQNYQNPNIKFVKELLETTLPTNITDNIIGALFSKLIVNACITSLGAVCGLYLGEMLAIKKIRRIFIEIMREAVKVAQAADIQIPPYDGKLDYYSVPEKDGFFAELKWHILIRVIGMKYKKLKSSSLQSLERGKLTEIHSLNGYIVDKGNQFSIPTPINAKIVEIIEKIEASTQKIELKNFDDPIFDRF